MAEYFFPLVYLLIGVFFGELSLLVQQDKMQENAPVIKLITYIFVIFTWPVIVLFAIVQSLNGDGS